MGVLFVLSMAVCQDATVGKGGSVGRVEFEFVTKEEEFC